MPANFIGLIDCATDARLYPLVRASIGHSCLYTGDIDPDLAPAAPYIVELREGEPLFNAWSTTGWGKNWGILCQARLPLSRVRFHFRHFLRVKLPDRRTVEFRFYDPRVFRVYLPSCDADDLASWFEGIQRFVVESDGDTGAIEYSLNSGRLLTRHVQAGWWG